VQSPLLIVHLCLNLSQCDHGHRQTIDTPSCVRIPTQAPPLGLTVGDPHSLLQMHQPATLAGGYWMLCSVQCRMLCTVTLWTMRKPSQQAVISERLPPPPSPSHNHLVGGWYPPFPSCQLLGALLLPLCVTDCCCRCWSRLSHSAADWAPLLAALLQ
jgi:hypothetical protein